MTPDRLNVAAEGSRSQGTMVRAACWRCGEEVSIRVPAVEVHQLNHERERAERAEAAARDFAEAAREVAAIWTKPATVDSATDLHTAIDELTAALAAHPDFAEPRA